MADAPAHEHDEIDGCELDFAAAAVDEDHAELLALFPDGKKDEAKAAEWQVWADHWAAQNGDGSEVER